MKYLFSNVWFTSVVIAFCLAGGILFGLLLDQAPSTVHTGITYGFAAFAVFPISLCVFGIKELNAAYPQIAPYLDSKHRRDLSIEIDKRIQVVIIFAFFIILIQVLGAFYLLYLATEYEKVTLGVLFGGVVSSLIYGLFVCFSVRVLAEKTEEIQSKQIGQNRIAEYNNKFKESQ